MSLMRSSNFCRQLSCLIGSISYVRDHDLVSAGATEQRHDVDAVPDESMIGVKRLAVGVDR